MPAAEDSEASDRAPPARAFLYDADGHDREIELDAASLSDVGERSLLWIDVIRRDPDVLHRIGGMLALDPMSLRELLRPQDHLYLDNYGEYFQFDVVALAPGFEGRDRRTLAERRPTHLEFLVGPRWVVTVHDGDLPFLRAFRDQDKGETLMGALSPAALVASLLDRRCGRRPGGSRSDGTVRQRTIRLSPVRGTKSDERPSSAVRANNLGRNRTPCP